ncbi:renalase-like [Thrips palmi]|uniref:Renalase-like n=1 Tax=Thrips palmi TaxID=161013 RepID=A0A6P9A001_THRPL|nr:renalase-like [Thrips palmi]XP_034251038.1 renalase-like [Thrips palmi]
MARKVLLVGSGITAAVTGALLRQKMREKISLTIWDKARGAGGRMGTSRSPGDAECIADLGAQYITVLPENFEKNREIYGNLLDKHILEPMSVGAVKGLKEFPSGTQHFVTPNGMSSLVKYFIGLSSPDATMFLHHVTAINKTGEKLQVETTTGTKEEFDVVILTLPAPQVLQLSGDLPDLINNQQDLRTGFEAVKFSSRYALALYFNSGDGQHEPWAAKYIDGHPVFRYVAIENRKRNRPEQPPAAVFHSSIQYGKENLENTLVEMEPVLLAEYKNLFQGWPKPAAVKCHKWRYSQVTTNFPGNRGCAVILKKPLLISGGDSFTGSGFDNCLYSANSVVDEVVEFLKLR